MSPPVATSASFLASPTRASPSGTLPFPTASQLHQPPVAQRIKPQFLRDGAIIHQARGGVGGDGEGGGVGEPGRCGVAEQMQSTCSLLRFTEYGAAGEWEEEKRKLAHMAHQDKNMLSIVCQLNEVDGLQVEAMDGEWLLAAPRSVASSSSRERLSTKHGVTGRFTPPCTASPWTGTVARYSAVLFSRPISEQTIQAPAELVDGDHPSLFRPFEEDTKEDEA
ncbi:hypothetical protein OPV22_017651 [Ensete ventricosum]|uniref:Isopenicillin N synthase-like Fe(2+) 2OG dioxygenase domain-containing protein n=1 Tax=Ensete ventricosum TaxID=4639 RepID=A0AAV8PHZ0_ENSVE|nr:hypothetical protein OPV22_017651 [Ensete ventricosum]